MLDHRYRQLSVARHETTEALKSEKKSCRNITLRVA